MDSSAQNVVPIQGALKEGAKGELVKRLQALLQQLGFDPGEYAGEFGRKTTEAMMALQRKLGLDPTGAYDRVTERGLEEEMKSGASSILKNVPAGLSDAIVATTMPVSTPTATPTPGTPATPAPGGIQALLKSPLFWIAASAGALYLVFGGGGSSIAIEGVEELGHGDEDDEVAEDDAEIELPAPPKKAYRKPKKKSRKKLPASDSANAVQGSGSPA